MQNLTNWSGARTLRASVTVLAEKLLPDPTGAAKELAEPRTRNERAMSDLMANLSDCRTFATSYQAPFSLLFRLSLKFDRINVFQFVGLTGETTTTGAAATADNTLLTLV